MTAPQGPADPDQLRKDAEAWQTAKPLLQALVALEPRCIPVLVGMARNLINDHQ